MLFHITFTSCSNYSPGPGQIQEHLPNRCAALPHIMCRRGFRQLAADVFAFIVVAVSWFRMLSIVLNQDDASSVYRQIRAQHYQSDWNREPEEAKYEKQVGFVLQIQMLFDLTLHITCHNDSSLLETPSMQLLSIMCARFVAVRLLAAVLILDPEGFVSY